MEPNKTNNVTDKPRDTDLDVPTYIGRAVCGCVLGAVVDDGTDRKGVAKWVASFVKSGLTVERVTVEYVRTHKFGCAHDTGTDHAPAAKLKGKRGNRKDARQVSLQGEQVALEGM